MSQDVSGMSQANLKQKEDTQGQLILMSQVSQVKLWIDIIQKFGDQTVGEKSPIEGT